MHTSLLSAALHRVIYYYYRKQYHLSSASVLSGVCETDCRLLPPIFSPLKACFSDEKSTSSSLDSSSSYFFPSRRSARKSSSLTSPPRNSGRISGCAYSKRLPLSSPIMTTLSRVSLLMRGVILAQMVSKSMGVLTKTRLSGVKGTG